jgi:hypothetical protein
MTNPQFYLSIIFLATVLLSILLRRERKAKTRLEVDSSKVPNDTYGIFVAKLKEQFGQALSFPENVEFEKVYDAPDMDAVEFRKMRGYWHIRFKVWNPENPYIDYLASGDDYSLHQRMTIRGETASLENFEGQFGSPIYEDEEKTMQTRSDIKAHNEKVQAILIAKGFLTSKGFRS